MNTRFVMQVPLVVVFLILGTAAIGGWERLTWAGIGFAAGGMVTIWCVAFVDRRSRRPRRKPCPPEVLAHAAAHIPDHPVTDRTPGAGTMCKY